jgi:hypothetical protein
MRYKPLENAAETAFTFCKVGIYSFLITNGIETCMENENKPSNWRNNSIRHAGFTTLVHTIPYLAPAVVNGLNRLFNYEISKEEAEYNLSLERPIYRKTIGTEERPHSKFSEVLCDD